MNAKEIHDNPTPDELRAFTEEMPTARVTGYGNVNVQTRVTSRSTGSTYVVTEDPSSTSQKAMPREEYDRVAEHAGRLHRAAGDAGHRRLHRQRGGLPHGRPAHDRTGEREHRRHAAEALLRADGRRRARGARDLHPEPGGAGLPGGPLHRRGPRERRDPRPGLGLLRRVQEGRPADVEHDRPRARRPGDARRRQVGAGERRREGVPDRGALRHRQDHHDVHHAERLAPGAGRLHRPDARRQGVRHRERLLREDVLAGSRLRAQHLQRGRQADHVPGERVPGRAGDRELLRAVVHEERPRGVRDERSRPVQGHRRAVDGGLPADPQPEREHHPGRGAKLSQEQAAAYFMLGETTGTSAGGAAEEGKFLRVPGTNPFFPLPTACRATGSSSCSTRTRWRST